MKTKIFTSVIFLIICISNLSAQVQSGSFFFDKSTPNYTLHENSGMRMVEREISFEKPFETKPQVVVTPTLIDAEKTTQIRYSIEAKGVSRDGFVIKVATWGNTQLNGIGGFWIAQAEKLEIKKEEIKVGTTIQLNNVYFEFNKWNLLPESFPELDKVVNFLKDNPTVEIELSGHTDNIGSDDYNLNLSQKRADAVKTYFVSKGVDAEKVTSKGYGKSKPIASNMTDSGREQNRRVEFTITKK